MKAIDSVGLASLAEPGWRSAVAFRPANFACFNWLTCCLATAAWPRLIPCNAHFMYSESTVFLYKR